MTEAQLEEELGRLGDEVVDLEGFLYLREYVDPSRLPARAGVSPSAASPGAPPAAPAWTWSPPSSPASPDEEPGRRWPPPAAAGGLGGCAGRGWRVIGVGVFLWWLISFIGGFIEGGAEQLPPQPTPVATPAAGGATPTPARSIAPTPSIGEVVGWTEIAVADCIVLPTEDVFYDLRRVPCDTPHGGEVFLIAQHPGASFPSDADFDRFADELCRPAFLAWTGDSLDEQDLLDLWWFAPTSEGWADGDRTIICYLAHADGSDAERSYRSSF
jgi:Septum formation